MKDLLGLADDLARLGMKVESLLEHEAKLRHDYNSTVVMLELVSLDIQHSYERVQDEIKALDRHGVTQ